MGKRFLLLFLLTLLVGSIFLFNYLVVKQTDKTAEHKAELASKEESNQIADRGDSTSEEDYGTVAYDTLFDNSVFHHFKIVMTKEEWKGLSDDMLAIAPVDENMRTGKYRKADLYYEDKNGQVKVGEVGIRTKGNLSRTLPEDSKGMNRFHFKIKFDETFQMSKETAGYAVRKDREFADLSSLNFKVNDGADPTNIREIFAYDLINSYGVTAPKASMATLTFVIEGVEHNFGVVRYIESVDKNFLTQRYGKKLNDGNLYKCLWQNYGPASLMPLSQTAEIGIKDSSKNYRPTYDRKTNENDIDYQDLQDFIENLNSGITVRKCKWLQLYHEYRLQSYRNSV